MRILVHACCGPCLLPVAQKLRESGHDPAAYFYNPNIHPYAEHQRRLEAFHKAIESLRLEALPAAPYEPQKFFRAVTFREAERCGACYRLRLLQTALAAREHGFEAFTTTLLISPYQDLTQVRAGGEAAGRTAWVEFLFEDFRPLFTQVRSAAEHLGLYRQHYCGCLYSEIEAEAGRRRKRERRGDGA